MRIKLSIPPCGSFVRRGVLSALLAVTMVVVAAQAKKQGPTDSSSAEGREHSHEATDDKATEKKSGSERESDSEASLYQCSMHPNVISEEPGVCPICGMDLQPVQELEGKGIPGRAPVQLSSTQRQLINIRVTPTLRTEASKSMRAEGVITYDESRVTDVTSKISGWVETLYVDKSGQSVEKGEPLMELYSPDLYSAQREYLLAYKATQRQRKASLGKEGSRLSRFASTNRRGYGSLLESARKRLELWGVSEEQIESLERSGEPKKTLKLTAPMGGTVVEKPTFKGQKIRPDMKLYRIADLSKLWLEVKFYEYELSLLEEGQTALIRVEAYPNRTFTGKVDFIYPYMETKTRTVRVRFVLDNEKGLLKPNMYAHAELHRPLGEQVLVPSSAVFHTGKHNYVFVDNGDGTYLPKEILLGPKTENHYVVHQGIQEGEPVVVDGNFLLDSESQLKATASASRGKESDGTPAQKDQIPVYQVPDDLKAQLSSLVNDYRQLSAQLTSDRLGAIEALTKRMSSTIHEVRLLSTMPDSLRDRTESALGPLEEALTEFPTGNLQKARIRFGKVSAALIDIVEQFPTSLDQSLQVVECPMWEKSPAQWIQANQQIENPFMGQSMLRCGEVVRRL